MHFISQITDEDVAKVRPEGARASDLWLDYCALDYCEAPLAGVLWLPSTLVVHLRAMRRAERDREAALTAIERAADGRISRAQLPLHSDRARVAADYRLLLVPVFDETIEHWSLLALHAPRRGRPSGRWHLYDTLGPCDLGAAGRALEALCWAGAIEPAEEVIRMPVPLQRDGHSCGHRVAALTKALVDRARAGCWHAPGDGDAAGGASAARLKEDLLSHYDRAARPAENRTSLPFDFACRHASPLGIPPPAGDMKSFRALSAAHPIAVAAFPHSDPLFSSHLLVTYAADGGRTLVFSSAEGADDVRRAAAWALGRPAELVSTAGVPFCAPRLLQFVYSMGYLPTDPEALSAVSGPADSRSRRTWERICLAASAYPAPPQPAVPLDPTRDFDQRGELLAASPLWSGRDEAGPRALELWRSRLSVSVDALAFWAASKAAPQEGPRCHLRRASALPGAPWRLDLPDGMPTPRELQAAEALAGIAAFALPEALSACWRELRQLGLTRTEILSRGAAALMVAARTLTSLRN